MNDIKELSINRVACSKCMGCVEMCPEIFAWNEHDEEIVLRRQCVTQNEVSEAMALCPRDCIELSDPSADSPCLLPDPTND
ncbi:ferredoxin [Desulfobaculum xiamenense]|uniref:Ferredoxin n=1 Tax=Desulfobaculum xiamenense TaxID=995050 RepID=A0A846QR47_9BACT|nr:ferredoxin [Desulfobaculum xiamenense]NJB67674.1 ferredoxin [Desulfobaculum xiamenense]